MIDTDLFWWLANTRYQMYENRLLAGVPVPSGDPILDNNRFTNTFRASDRVSQRLIRLQQEGPQDEHSLVFRTLLFKVFNREETWDYLEECDLTTHWDPSALKSVLDSYEGPIFSGAYVMVNKMLEGVPKHHFYIDAIDGVLKYNLGAVLQAQSLDELVRVLRSVPGFGPFLSYQYAIDLNYSALFRFSENDTVVAGPGALRGLQKLFGNSRMASNKIMDLALERDRGPLLMGVRPMHLIDVQNMLCEYDKYTRVAHGESGRMKQRYRPNPEPLPDPVWPESWVIA